MKIGTLTTGDTVASNFKMNYLPQVIYFIAATQITSMKVTVAGDGVICDLNALGLSGVSGMRRYGAVANSFYIQIADGFIPNKVVEIDVINSAVQTPILYGHSLQRGAAYITHMRETVLAASGKVFQDFMHLCVLSMATTDLMTIGFDDGHVQDVESTELLGIYTLYSNEVDSYCVDNLGGFINYVKLTPAADRVVVVSRVVPIGEVL